MRAIHGNGLQEIGEHGKVRVPRTLVVEIARAKELQLGAMVCVTVNLPVIELNGANRLIGREVSKTFRAQTAIRTVLPILLEPSGDSGRRDDAICFLFQTSGRFFEGVADV